MNKSAEEMFKELGFEQFASSIYVNNKNDIVVTFIKQTSEYAVRDSDCEYVVVDMELHKAINKQLEELGWIDE